MYTLIKIAMWLLMGLAGLSLVVKYGNKRPINLIPTIALTALGPITLMVGGIMYLDKVSEDNCMFHCGE